MLAILLVIGFVSCEKEHQDRCENENQEATKTLLIDETPTSFSDLIPAAFDEMAVLGATENEALYMDNEGIPVFLDEEPFGVEDLQTKAGSPCHLLGEHELNKEQKAKLMASWKSYLECRHTSMKKLRAYYREMHAKMEKRRVELLHALHANRITHREFNAAMEKLRHEFRAEMMKHGRVNQDVIRHCYKSFLERAQHILTERQFKMFMHCHKHRLPLHRRPDHK